MIPVVLSGGVGSRLWPVSRGMYPKQLLPLAHPELSMLQQTILRTEGLQAKGEVIVVCNEDHRFMVGEQLNQIDANNSTILLEPEGRNTAPAIALAALKALESDQEAVLLVMPADHVIADVDLFQRAVNGALEYANDGALITFGVVAKQPETGYGYIKRGPSLAGGGFEVEAFKEKPELKHAQQYLDSGEYYWNSGIFLFRAAAYLDELQKFAPDIFSACQSALDSSANDLDFVRVDADAFSMSPFISIDYAVMEKTDNAVVMPLDVGWSDVGSWSALWDVSDKDSNGNAVFGDVLLHDTKNSHIRAETKLVTAIGVENLVIVETDDAVMVIDKSKAQSVKEIVVQLKELDRAQLHHHRKVYRPWGWYDSVDAGDRFQVKRIQVNPGARLSVQMHHHRAEHWVVVRGQAEVLNGDKTIVLNENESTYIPIGQTHALRNRSNEESLEIIEVQSGSYLGEDDIVRFEDVYGRS